MDWSHITYVGVWLVLAIASLVTCGFMVRECVLSYRLLRSIKADQAARSPKVWDV